MGQGIFFIEAARPHSDTPHSGRVRSPEAGTSEPHNTQYSKEIGIHASGGIRNGSPNKQAATGPCHRTRGHWDRQCRSNRFIYRIICTIYARQMMTLLQGFKLIKSYKERHRILHSIILFAVLVALAFCYLEWTCRLCSLLIRQYELTCRYS